MELVTGTPQFKVMSCEVAGVLRVEEMMMLKSIAAFRVEGYKAHAMHVSIRSPDGVLRQDCLLAEHTCCDFTGSLILMPGSSIRAHSIVGKRTRTYPYGRFYQFEKFSVIALVFPKPTKTPPLFHHPV